MMAHTSKTQKNEITKEKKNQKKKKFWSDNMIKYKLLPADISFSGMDQQLCASTSLY